MSARGKGSVTGHRHPGGAGACERAVEPLAAQPHSRAPIEAESEGVGSALSTGACALNPGASPSTSRRQAVAAPSPRHQALSLTSSPSSPPAAASMRRSCSTPSAGPSASTAPAHRWSPQRSACESVSGRGTAPSTRKHSRGGGAPSAPRHAIASISTIMPGSARQGSGTRASTGPCPGGTAPISFRWRPMSAARAASPPGGAAWYATRLTTSRRPESNSASTRSMCPITTSVWAGRSPLRCGSPFESLSTCPPRKAKPPQRTPCLKARCRYQSQWPSGQDQVRGFMAKPPSRAGLSGHPPPRSPARSR